MLAVLISLLLVTDSRELSEALGHWIGKNLQQLPLDVDALVKGIRDQAAGKESPMDETACLHAVGELEEEERAENIRKERAEAEEFLEENREKEGVCVLAEGHVQYEVVREGKGEALNSYNSPIVRCAGGTELLSLDSLTEGLKLGLAGMREGEIRKLYIHPDLAGTDGLKTVEIELVQADGSAEAVQAAESEENVPFVR